MHRLLKIALLSPLLFSSAFAFAQINLVPNPSFEDTTACPQAPDELFKSNGWNSYNGSPDFMHICSSGAVGVPINWGGYQQPASGNAYSAIATFSGFVSNYREYAGHQLFSPLNVGIKYFVSFKISLSLGYSTDANCASNKIGARFSMSSPLPTITNNAQIYTDSIIIDSIGWTRIFGSFISDSAYIYIALGNFFDDANTDTTKFYSTFSDASYYFLDDICVSTDSLFALNYTYSGMEENNPAINFIFYPNPVQDYLTINSPCKIYSLAIHNALGQEVFKFENINDKFYTFDVSKVCSGMLFLNITTENSQFNYKLLKQ